MMLLRRAPREVYHVYSEDEFLGGTICGEPLRGAGATAGRRRLYRFAGATLLLVAAGVVGGLVVITSAQSLAGGRRRVRARSEAASESLAAARASRPSVWRQRVTAGNDRAGRGSVSHHTARQHGRALTVLVVEQKPEVAEPSELARERESAPTPQSPSVEVMATAGPASEVAAVAGATGGSGQAEFGFER